MVHTHYCMLPPNDEFNGEGCLGAEAPTSL